MEQKFISEKTDEGYYVEVFNDNKIVWTDTFATEEGLNWFIKCCNNGKEFEYFHTSQEEGRTLLENGEYGVDIFYRHPLGYRFTSIYNEGAMPENNKHGFCVFFVNKDNFLVSRTVTTIDEAFQIIKDVENGKI